MEMLCVSCEVGTSSVNDIYMSTVFQEAATSSAASHFRPYVRGGHGNRPHLMAARSAATRQPE
jgi:hypothetical protein